MKGNLKFEVKSMDKESETMGYQFDAFCSKVLINEARDIQRQRKGYYSKIVPLNSEECYQDVHLITEDHYNVFDEKFEVFHQEIPIENSHLAKALRSLTSKKRKIILLAYMFGLNDEEISLVLQIPRRTVNYHRNSALVQLNGFLGDHYER